MSAILVFSEEEAALGAASLRTALLGGSWPPGARSFLYGLIDAFNDTTDELVDVAEVRGLIAAIRERGE